MDVEGKHILVVGAARSGLAAAHILARRGAIVTVTDRKSPGEFRDALSKLIKDKVGLELGVQREETFLRHQAIVISPGVPWDLPELEAARKRKIPIYPEVEVATWFLQGTMVGVTGSNGKTTTTTLLGKMLSASGFPTFVGGNIGNALSSAVGHVHPGTKFVTELSSFQLEAIHDLRPQVAVMLNLSPNHLDRHPSLEAYAAAKRQIFRNQGEGDFAVLNADDPWVAGLRTELHSRPVLFSRKRELPTGVFVSAGKVYYRVRHLERLLFETRDVPLRGDFNLEDVLAATTAACVLGADFTAIRKAVREFKAVEHRLEFVGEIQGVQFFNNSKATSVDATVKSLGAFERGVHLIMGGKDKGAPYTPLLPLIKNRVREILLVGAAAPTIAAQLSGSTELVQAGDLATAVRQAYTHSQPGETVLLAPACSSFDQFKDYEERGRVFKELVKQLERDVREGKVARLAAASTEKKVSEPAIAPAKVSVRSLQPAEVPGGEVATAAQEADSGELQPAGGEDKEKASIETETLESSSPVAIEKSEIQTEEHLSDVPDPEIAEAEPASIPLEAAAGLPSTVEAIKSASESIEDHLQQVEQAVAESDDQTGQPDTGRETAAEPETLMAARVQPVEGVESAAAEPAEPFEKGSERPLELTYIFEVDAVEMPGGESQLIPEEEPVISISASTLEEAEEPMPYETRAAGSGARGAESANKKSSGEQSKKSEARDNPQQQRLPGVE